LSDHFLLRWEVRSTRAAPSCVPVCTCPWRQLDLESLRSALCTSKLCQPDGWPAEIDDMADMYDRELNAQLDQQIPIRHFVCQQRSSDPWFDKECRVAKRLTRRLE